MGILDTLKTLSQTMRGDQTADALLEPLLASYGIEAGRVSVDPSSGQVVLALRIHGQARVACIPTDRTFTRAEICRLIAAPPKPPPDP